MRANETMEGRARLYGRSDARGHAARALRIGTLGRLADRLGLPRAAAVDEVVSATDAVTGHGRRELEALLGEHEPGSDAALMRLSDQLQSLEHDVAAATSLGPETPAAGSTDKKEGS